MITASASLAKPHTRAFWRAGVLRILLLVGLLFSGTVPQGMMRAGGDDGMRLVLCTEAGPTEMILAPDGTLKEIPVEMGDSAGKCLGIALSLDGVQASLEATPRDAEFAAFIPDFQTDVAPAEAPRRIFASRAPPAFL